MKIKIGYMAVLFFIGNNLPAQTLVADSRFGATYSHEQGELVMTSTLGVPIPSTDYQNNLAVVTDHINLPLSTDTTSNHDLMPLQGIQVFPNPTPDLLLLARETWDEDYRVDVFSPNGQTVNQTTWEKGIQSLQISFSGLPVGTYLVTVANPSLTMRTTYKIQKR